MIKPKHPKMWEMLFVLGHVLHESNRMLSGRGLNVYVSKADFISIVKSVGAVSKHDRTVYKNLEMLEKKKLISYTKGKKGIKGIQKRNVLGMTQKGKNAFFRLKQDHNEKNGIIKKIASNNLLKTDRKIQTVLSS